LAPINTGSDQFRPKSSTAWISMSAYFNLLDHNIILLVPIWMACCNLDFGGGQRMRIYNEILGAIFGLTLIGVAGSAAAVPFEFQGTCVAGCANQGLTDLDPVSGEITFSNSAIAPNAAVDTSDVTSFSFSFGSFAIDDADAVGFFFDGTLNGTGSSFTAFSFVASESLSGSGDTLFFFLNGAGVSDQGRFGPGRCIAVCAPLSVGTQSGIASFGSSPDFTLTRVPEPASIGLFVIGLGMLSHHRRRRRANDA